MPSVITEVIPQIFRNLGVPAHIRVTLDPSSQLEATFTISCLHCTESQTHKHGYLLPNDVLEGIIRVFSRAHVHDDELMAPLLDANDAASLVRVVLGNNVDVVLSAMEADLITKAPTPLDRQLAINQVAIRHLDRASHSTQSPGLRSLRGALQMQQEQQKVTLQERQDELLYRQREERRRAQQVMRDRAIERDQQRDRERQAQAEYSRRQRNTARMVNIQVPDNIESARIPRSMVADILKKAELTIATPVVVVVDEDGGRKMRI